MRKSRVYLETSFMFYLTGRETNDVKVASDQAYTRKWWAEEGPKCDLFTSPFVIIESNDRDPEYVEKRDEKIAETKEVIESFGLHCPQIITPRSYLEDFCDERQ